MLYSVNNFCTHMILAMTLARALYSASELDLDTIACFLALQEIIFDIIHLHLQCHDPDGCLWNDAHPFDGSFL